MHTHSKINTVWIHVAVTNSSLVPQAPTAHQSLHYSLMRLIILFRKNKKESTATKSCRRKHKHFKERANTPFNLINPLGNVAHFEGRLYSCWRNATAVEPQRKTEMIPSRKKFWDSESDCSCKQTPDHLEPHVQVAKRSRVQI